MDQDPPQPLTAKKRYIFAAVGDVHGQFSKMVNVINAWEQVQVNHGNREKNEDVTVVDFVLQVGDLEPHRHERDLASMAMPSKHRTLGDFHKVLSGEVPLPWPTYFIGGNHEPWEFLDQHEGAGFALIPNLNFLGRSSVTTIGPLRVAAMSGIDSANEFSYHEQRPHVSEFPHKSNKAYIHFNHSEVMALVDAANDQHQKDAICNLQLVRTILSAELGLKPRAIESILSESGAHVRCIDDLARLSDQALKTAGVLAGPREKIAAYQEQLRARRVDGNAKADGASTDTGDSANVPPITPSNPDPLTNISTSTSGAVTMCASEGLVDVLVTHDWPSGIADPIAHAERDARCRALGNDPCRLLLENLRPTLMLCGHMHTAHTAVVGPSVVRCLAKVPAAGSVAFFEVLDTDIVNGISSDDDGQAPHTPTGRRLGIRELG